MDNVFAIIMAGGKGERFWPLSTNAMPKQLLKIFGNKSLISMACSYLDGFVANENIFVVTSDKIAEPIRNELFFIPKENVIGEPEGRDTAAAITTGLAKISQISPNAIVCILTADHIIENVSVFRATLLAAIEMAKKNDVLITFGITPSYPSSGFGYIEAQNSIGSMNSFDFFKVLRFVEKPNKEKAIEYVRSGKFFWNSGIFVWNLKTFVESLKKFNHNLFQTYRKLSSKNAAEFIDTMFSEYRKLDKISVDYAILEKADNIIMAKCDFGWDDVGSWSSIERHFHKDVSGNTLIGKIEQIDSENNIVVSENRLTALIGVKDLVIVNSSNATLVCHKDRVQDVKKIVKILEEKGKYGDAL